MDGWIIIIDLILVGYKNLFDWDIFNLTKQS